MPKSSYLNWAKRAADDPDAGLRERIKEIFADTGSIYGFRRIGIALRDEGLTVSALFIRELPEGKRDYTKHFQKGQLHRQQQNGDILWTHEREMYYSRKFTIRKELCEAIDMYIKFYNENKYQIKLKSLPPLNSESKSNNKIYCPISRAHVIFFSSTLFRFSKPPVIKASLPSDTFLPHPAMLEVA